MAENPSTFAIIFNYFLLSLFVCSAIWAFFDVRKRGRPFSEAIAWALFMGAMFPLAIVVYVYFRRKKLL